MTKNNAKAKLVVTIVGIGYVGLSNAVLLAQHNKVYAVDIQPERVNAVSNRCSPIMDKELEEYFAVKDMDLTAVMDGIQAYRDADFIIISTPHQLRSGQKLLRHLLRRVSHRGSPENQP